MKKINHKKIGKKLDLYYFDKDSPGMIFWKKNGLLIYNNLKKIIKKKINSLNYIEVKTPSLLKKVLWENTGHYSNFKKNIFKVKKNNVSFCIKPMNCPGHIKIFKSELRSYKNLPMKIFEFGECYRYEPSGSLYGLMRTRHFTQDDGHIFCRESQIINEITECIEFIYETYNLFGLKKIKVKLSTSSIGKNNKYYYKAERFLEYSLIKKKIKFYKNLEDGAFYGPKIEFILFDYLDREWQCGTIQLDFLLSKKLNVFYINKNNEKLSPVIIHRAIFGSIERFIGIILEKFNGNLPLWIVPIQVIILSINSNQKDYIKKVFKILLKNKIRVDKDVTNKTLNNKIRNATLKKIPYIIICGEKEKVTNTIDVRFRNKHIGYFYLYDFIKLIKIEVNSYKL
ncbi:MAG: threonine--tRNA ligase [Enterobacteriaceae bacterium]